MGLKDTAGWVKQWGIFSRRDEMSAGGVWRWLRQWVPFGARTIFYGSISITFGPLTRERRASTWAMKNWSRGSLKGLEIDVKLTGEARVPEGSFVYISNHQSLLDTLLLGAVLPGDFKWAAKRAIMHIPFLGWHLRLAGHVPVDRGKGRATSTVDRFVAVLERGKPLLVFPEGTRSADGEIRPFKNGGFLAAVRAGRPVVPVVIEGTGRIMGKGAVDSGEGARRHRQVSVAIGDPIYPQDDGDEEQRVEDLRDRTHQVILTRYRELRPAIRVVPSLPVAGSEPEA